MHAPNIEHVTDTVQDVAHKVADRAPDIANAVGRSARSTAESVSDAVMKLAQMTPFVEAPKPQHHRMRWMVRAAIIATVAGIAMWFVNRRRVTSRPWSEGGETPTTQDAGLTTERRFATAGR